MTKLFYKLLFLLITLFCSWQKTYSQDSSHLRISLLTCTPGEELYSTFGHSAIRIVDSNSVTDVAYNYGTFNFDDPDFYTKFIRGKLLYYISVQNYTEFKADYQAMNRGIREQVLDFSAEEKLNIQYLLNENLKEENRFYKYDFFLDNCTTRLRDLIVKAKHPPPDLPPVMPLKTTFRNAIHQYLKNSGQDWSMFGIDVLLGSPTDAIMTKDQQQFLPDNLMASLDSSKNVKMVQGSSVVISQTGSNINSGWFTPFVFFILLLLLYITLGMSRSRSVRIILTVLDGTLFFATGLIGILIIFMMTSTDHAMAKNNFNIAWAWPTHFIISFFISSRSKFISIYFLLVSVCMVLLLLSWFFLPQQMNNALIPFVILLLYRSAKKYNSSNYNYDA